VVQQLVALVVIAVLQKVLVIQIMPLVVQIVLQQLLPLQPQLHYQPAQVIVLVSKQNFVLEIMNVGVVIQAANQSIMVVVAAHQPPPPQLHYHHVMKIRVITIA